MSYQPKNFQFDRFSEWNEDLLREEMEEAAKVPVIRDDDAAEYYDKDAILAALYPRKGPQPGSIPDRAIKALYRAQRTMTTAEIAGEIGIKSKALSEKLWRYEAAGYLRYAGQIKHRGRMVNTWRPIEEGAA